MTITRRHEGTTGYVTLDNPPINAIDATARQDLIEAVDWAETLGLDRVILCGAGRMFSGGADATEFDAPITPPTLPLVMNRIEASTVPWIAAVHGVALGGGCEIMLACRYRVATPDATIGLPEVQLGIVPGAGGTQRLPRLIGIEAALDIIPAGNSVSGTQAAEIGLVDALAEDPVAAAQEVAGDLLATAVAVGDRPGPAANEAACAEARALADRRMPGQEAPRIAIDLIAETSRLDLAAGLDAEEQVFHRLRHGAQSRALRHIFFTERGARAPKGLKDVAPVEVTKATVVGGGTMGAGIAYALLTAGVEVVLLEVNADSVAWAEANVEKIIAAALQRGLIDAAGAAQRRAALTATDDDTQAHGSGIAIEAADGPLQVKHAVLTRLQAVMRPDAVFATTTSWLDVNEIAAVLDDPARLIGLHFGAPAPATKLLEIIRGDASADAALATGFALAKRLRKLPVLAGVGGGAIGTRILTRFREAADALLMAGATPWGVDAAMVDFGYAMGPYEAQDLAGLDIAQAERQRQDAARSYVPIVDRMVAEGRLGKDVGLGWYRYADDGGKRVDSVVERLVREEAAATGVAQRAFSAEDIQARLLVSMINEAATLLDEGIARNAADIDLVTVAGHGFPRWRGGLMHYADTLGPSAILDRLTELQTEDPEAWKPAALIVRLAADGKTFSAV